MKSLLAFPIGFVIWITVGSIPKMLGMDKGFGVFFFLLIGPVAGIFVGYRWLSHFQDIECAEAQRELDAENQKRAEESRQAEQHTLALRLVTLVSDSVQTASTLPQLVRESESALDSAEQEFSDGAFAPFWDAVETAATRLATFNNTVQQLIQNSTFHRSESSKLDTRPAPFQLGVDTLPDASHTAHRMRSVVRRAQKDFHFATIYEQRKTNQLLVAGFSTLGQAINELGDRLDSSLESLASSISIAISDQTSALVSELETSREQAASDSAAQREHESKEREMLDNIQRRRKPRPPGLRDGEY